MKKILMVFSLLAVLVLAQGSIIPPTFTGTLNFALSCQPNQLILGCPCGSIDEAQVIGTPTANPNVQNLTIKVWMNNHTCVASRSGITINTQLGGANTVISGVNQFLQTEINSNQQGAQQQQPTFIGSLS